jgi:hypothetical protein
VAVYAPQLIPAIAKLGAVGSLAASAAIGSTVSQGVGLATGIQDKFSFKSVALAALSAGVGAGLGEVVKLGTAVGSSAFAKVAGDVVRGALGNAITQGVATATGLQDKFDWTGVAVGGVVGGAIGVANRTMAANGIGAVNGTPQARARTIGNYANQGLSGAAGALAGAATRSLLTGTDFGDNIAATLPDVIANTIGNIVAGGIAAESAARRADKAAAQGVFESVAGAKPTTREEKARVREYARSITQARHEFGRPGTKALSGATADLLDRNLNSLLDVAANTPAGKAQVSAFRDQLDSIYTAKEKTLTPTSTNAVQDGPEIVITPGLKSPWTFARSIDGGGIWLGQKEEQLGQGVAAAIEKVPGAKVALNVANVGLTIWGGPVRYAAGYVFESFKDKIKGGITDSYKSVNYDEVQAQQGGSGITLAGSILLSGLGSLKVIGRPERAPIWTETAQKSRVQNAYGHWKDHASEFPEFQNSKQYVDAARSFVTKPPAGTLTKTRPNGDVLFYNPQSNTFGVRAKNGAPRTMFRPDAGLEYWNKQ